MPRLSRKAGPAGSGTGADSNGAEPPTEVLRCVLCNRKLGEFEWSRADSPLELGEREVRAKIQCTRCKTINEIVIRP